MGYLDSPDSRYENYQIFFKDTGGVIRSIGEVLLPIGVNGSPPIIAKGVAGHGACLMIPSTKLNNPLIFG